MNYFEILFIYLFFGKRIILGHHGSLMERVLFYYNRVWDFFFPKLKMVPRPVQTLLSHVLIILKNNFIMILFYFLIYNNTNNNNIFQ